MEDGVGGRAHEGPTPGVRLRVDALVDLGSAQGVVGRRGREFLTRWTPRTSASMSEDPADSWRGSEARRADSAERRRITPRDFGATWETVRVMK